MSKKIIIAFISTLFSIGIFISSIFFLSLFNVSHGITKEDVTDIVNQFDIEETLKQFETYNNLDKENQKIIIAVFEDEEVEEYIKEIIGNIYTGIIYNKNIDLDTNKLTTLVNDKTEEIQEKYGMTEENIETIKSITKQMENDMNEVVNEKIENSASIQVIRTIFSKKTSYYPLIFVIALSVIVVLINEKYKGLAWAGVPTIIAGALFLLLSLSLDGTIKLDGNLMILESIENLTKTIKISSVVYIIIGIIEIAIYEIYKLKENGVIYGKNGSI